MMILAFLFNNFSNTIGTVQDIINVADIIFPEEHERTDRNQLKDLINIILILLVILNLIINLKLCMNGEDKMYVKLQLLVIKKKFI